MKPNEAELRETVERMEARLGTHPLYPTYERLVERFVVDLPEERDVLLARSAVLMLLEEEAATRASGW